MLLLCEEQFYPSHVQKVQVLHQGYRPRRLEIHQGILEKYRHINQMINYILFTDESKLLLTELRIRTYAYEKSTHDY